MPISSYGAGGVSNPQQYLQASQMRQQIMQQIMQQGGGTDTGCLQPGGIDGGNGVQNPQQYLQNSQMQQQEMRMLQEMMQLMEEFMGGGQGGGGCPVSGPGGVGGQSPQAIYQAGYQAGEASAEGSNYHQVETPEMQTPEYKQGFQAGEAAGQKVSQGWYGGGNQGGVLPASVIDQGQLPQAA